MNTTMGNKQIEIVEPLLSDNKNNSNRNSNRLDSLKAIHDELNLLSFEKFSSQNNLDLSVKANSFVAEIEQKQLVQPSMSKDTSTLFCEQTNEVKKCFLCEWEITNLKDIRQV